LDQTNQALELEVDRLAEEGARALTEDRGLALVRLAEAHAIAVRIGARQKAATLSCLMARAWSREGGTERPRMSQALRFARRGVGEDPTGFARSTLASMCELAAGRDERPTKARRNAVLRGIAISLRREA
jgi:hypothetical protein